MGKKKKKAGGKQSANALPKIDPAVIAAHIENAIVDCYDEEEVSAGWLAYLDDELALPFDTVVFGATVTVEELDSSDRGEIVAVCKHGKEKIRVLLLDLPLPSPPPDGWEVIEAYRQF